MVPAGSQGGGDTGCIVLAAHVDRAQDRDDLPDVRTGHDSGAATGRTVPEDDAWVLGHAERLVDQALSERRGAPARKPRPALSSNPLVPTHRHRSTGHEHTVKTVRSAWNRPATAWWGASLWTQRAPPALDDAPAPGEVVVADPVDSAHGAAPARSVCVVARPTLRPRHERGSARDGVQVDLA